jgi:hypothetical protein
VTTHSTSRLHADLRGHCSGSAVPARAELAMLNRSIRRALTCFSLTTLFAGTTVGIAHSIPTVSGQRMARSLANGGEEHSLTARHSSKCLDVSGFSQADGGNVFQWRCMGGLNQTWKLYFTGGGYAMLVAKHSGKCLDVANGSPQSGANVIQWGCNGSNSQLWHWIYIRTVSGIPYYILENRQTSKCLDVAGFSQADGGNVFQWDCTATDNQLWDFYNLRHGYHGI